MLVDKSDEETVEEDTQVEQTSAASLAWVLDTCAEAVVELTDAEDFESLPRLVATLGGSGYLHDIVGSINRKYYKRKLRQHEARAGKGVEPDPEEEEYWRYEIPHTISPRNEEMDEDY